MNRLSATFLFIIVFFSSCRKEHDSQINCDAFHFALESHNDTQLQLLLYPITVTIGELPSYDDHNAREEKVMQLIQRLNDSYCDISVDSHALAIKTNPPMVDLFATSTRTGHTFHLDFRTQEGRQFEFVATHQ